jgi:hypothetical protein
MTVDLDQRANDLSGPIRKFSASALRPFLFHTPVSARRGWELREIG